MKRCPECRRDYYDDSLLYCLEDGATLITGVPDEPATAILDPDAPTRLHGAETKPHSDSETSLERRSVSANRAAKPLVVVGVVGLILIGAVLSYRYFGSGARQIDSVAVMPFVNQSGDPNIEYLSEGMTDTLISSLTQLPDLGVKPRSSVFRYKGKDVDAKTIGKELNVAAILNGTVVQRGNEMALHVELIDTATETLLWSKDYKGPVANLVALQSGITRDVVDKLKLKLSGKDEQKLTKKYTESGEAYQLYLQGRYFWNKQTIKDNDRSIEYFQRAIAIDPNFALAYSGLADAYSLNIPGADREKMAKAREAALKALSLDDGLAEPHASLGRILAVDDYNFAGAERELRTAISLNPNYGTGHHFLATLLGSMGRFEEAFAGHQRALELEPLSAVFHAGYGASLTHARRYDEAAAKFNKALELEPNHAPAYGRLSVIAEIAGRYEECVELRAKALELGFGGTRQAAQIRESFAKGGREGYYRFVVSEDSDPSVAFYNRAVAYTALNEKDNAFDALNKSYENHEILLIQFLKNDQRLDPLRSDPRFQDLLRRVGFAN